MATLILLFCFSCFSSSVAFGANMCSDAIIDETGKLTDQDLGNITAAINQLANVKVDVRVRILSNFKGHTTLESLKDKLLTKCGSWRAKGNSPDQIGMNPNLFVIMISLDPKSLLVTSGDALKSKIGPRLTAINADIGAQLNAGNFGDAIMAGLKDAFDLKELNITQQNATSVSIVRNEAADTSGFVKILEWIVVLFVIIAICILALRIYQTYERRRAAQREAQSQRSRCTVAINGFQQLYQITLARMRSSKAPDEKKNPLIAELEDLKARFNAASSSYSTASRDNDPSISGLSEDEYEAMAEKFRTIADRLEGIIQSIPRIEAKLSQPDPVVPPRRAESSAQRRESPNSNSKPEPIRRPRDRRPDDRRPFGSPATPPPAPASAGSGPGVYPGTSVPASGPTVIRDTTVIHEGGGSDILTGMMIGDMLHHHQDDDRRRDRHDDGSGGGGYTPPSSSYPAPAASPGDSDERAWGNASKGDSATTTWGNASTGDSATTAWGRDPDFGRTPARAPDPEPVRDCREADCKAADCTRDCDCDCDCGGGGGDNS